jgi:hypothetical protein
MAFHEGKACDAVIRVLEAREGHSRHDVRSPEEDGNPAPIELTCLIDGRLFAFEHTGIEPFAGHVKFEAEAKRHLDPIRTGLAGRLPPRDVFELHMPAMAMQGKRKRELEQIQTALAEWIVATAPTVTAMPYASYDRSIQKVRPAGVPFKVSLHRFLPAAPLPGHFQIKHEISGNLEEAREDRLREACARKFPKLEAWRQNSGARTVLILENNDLQLTNPQRVFDVLTQVEMTIAGRPDEIHLVSTMIDNPWYVHALRIDDHTYYRLSEFRLRMTEIDSSTLVDLTGR